MSEASTWQCHCGYEFGQSPEKVVDMLRGQRTGARMALVFLLGLDAAALGAVIYSAFHGFVVFSIIGFTALAMWTLRTLHKLSVTNASLRQLTKAPLPEARTIAE